MATRGGEPFDEVDRQWLRFGRIALSTIVGAGLASVLAILYLDIGSFAAGAGLDALLIMGIVPAWAIWAGIAAGRFADAPSVERGVPIAVLLVVMALHLLLPASFATYLDIVEPLAAVHVAWWLLGWLVYGAAGALAIWYLPLAIERRLL